MAEQWIIRVQDKDYGPADIATLREWKADGRVLPTNAARQVDVGSGVGASTKETPWQTAAEIPGLFKREPPPVQIETVNQSSEIPDQKLESKPPERNIFIETFRIYFQGFFQF